MGARWHVRLLLAVTVALLMLVCFGMFIYIKFLNERKVTDFHETLGHRETTEEWTQRIGRPADISLYC